MQITEWKKLSDAEYIVTVALDNGLSYEGSITIGTASALDGQAMATICQLSKDLSDFLRLNNVSEEDKRKIVYFIKDAEAQEAVN